MRIATTLTLAIIAALAGTYAVMEYSGTTKRLFRKEEPALGNIQIRELTQFEIALGQRRQTFEREEGRWRVAVPVEDSANVAWITEVLKAIDGLKASEYLEIQASSSEEYGFTPETTLTLNLSHSEQAPITLQIGGPGNVPDSVYVKTVAPVKHPGVFVVPADLRQLLDHSLEKVVDPVLVRFTPDGVTGLSLTLDQDVVELKRNRVGNLWRAVKPVDQPADADRVNGLLDRLGNMEITRVWPSEERAALFTGESPRGMRRVVLWDESHENVVEISLLPDPDDNEAALAKVSRRDHVYSVARAFLTELPRRVETLRESRLLRIDLADVERLSIQLEGRDPVKLEQTGSVWFLESGEFANAEQAEELIKLVNESEVEQYFDDVGDVLGVYGLDKPFVTVTFEGQDLGTEQNKRIVMKIGRPVGNAPLDFAMIEGENHVAGVRKVLLTSFASWADPLKWKRLEVLNVADDTFKEILLEKSEQPAQRLVFDFDHEDVDQRLRFFEGEKDRTLDIDQKEAGELMWALGSLSANRWVTETDSVAERLKKPILTITVTTEVEAEEEKQEVIRKLHFAAVSDTPANAFYYGRLDEPEQAAFLISKEKFETLAGKSLMLESPGQ